MLWTFFDESGHKAEHPIVAMAGWLGSKEDFGALDERWSLFLREYGLSEFHAKDISPDHGPCKGWPQKRIHKLRHDAVTAITEGQRLFGIGHAVKVPDYDRIVGDNKWLRARFGSPYQLCCEASIQTAFAWMNRIPKWANEQLSIVFAQANEHEGDVGRCKEKYVTRNYYGDRIASITTCNAKTLSLLQAADFHAHETFLHAKSYFYGDAKHTQRYKRLIVESLGPPPTYLDAEGMCEFGHLIALSELHDDVAAKVRVVRHLLSVCK